MVKKVAFSLLLICFTSTHSFAQNEEADSVIQQVFDILTLDEHQVSGNIDSALTAGTWEALAYWDKSTPKAIESMTEAVGDRYRFSNGKFYIEFIDPSQPNQIGVTASGYYIRRRYTLELFKEANGPKQTMEIWYADENYLVLESDGLRLFFTHETSYYVEE